MADHSDSIQRRIAQAKKQKKPLSLQGEGSKRFYGRQQEAPEILSLHRHEGLINYHPDELIISLRCGTPLQQLDTWLAENGQILPFDPPHFASAGTIGGALACGLSGPGKPWSGGARDCVLGMRVLSGDGEILRFGGEVVKNVAGYDLFRPMIGALGTLAVVLDISLRLLPKAPFEHSLMLPLTWQKAHAMMLDIACRPFPLSAVCYMKDRLFIRLSGQEEDIAAAVAYIGGTAIDNKTFSWIALRDHQLDFFTATSKPLWRVLVKASSPLPKNLQGDWLIDWAGSQRWLLSDEPEHRIRSYAEKAGGKADLFRGGDRQSEVFHPPEPILMGYQRRIKHSFDPASILNPGRLYQGL